MIFLQFSPALLFWRGRVITYRDEVTRFPKIQLGQPSQSTWSGWRSKG
jgi:hypothetical protein